MSKQIMTMSSLRVLFMCQVNMLNREPQHGASHGQESASQAQGKRKRPVHRRKKKVRSLESLIHQVSVQSGVPGALSSDSEDGDGDTQMHSSDSDKSPGASDSDE